MSTTTERQLGRIEVIFDAPRNKPEKGHYVVWFYFSQGRFSSWISFIDRKNPAVAAQKAIDWINSRRSMFSEYIEPNLKLGDKIEGKVRRFKGQRKGQKIHTTYKVIVPSY